jgi:hypothetical protein
VNEIPPNVLLVLLRLDLKTPQQVLPGEGAPHDNVQFLVEGKQYHLLAGVLDPSDPRSSGAPITLIELADEKLKTYNAILRDFHKISQKFYRQGGFIEKPQSYSQDEQEDLAEQISDIGCLIYDLFEDEDPSRKERRPIRDWLGKVLHSEGRRTQTVTIVTNDLNIPWFWLKRQKYGRFLCEVCPLGLLQLSAGARMESPDRVRSASCFRALVIEGAANLPFVGTELDAISGFLGSSNKRLPRTFEPHRVTGVDDIRSLHKSYRKQQLLDEFRIIHFSGDFDREAMILKGESLDWDDLHSFNLLRGALLVLDGLSRAAGSGAWSDVQALTSVLINEWQTMGCIVSVLPVKDDPIISRVFWGAFYKELRLGSSTVAQALLKARGVLRDHFEAIGSKNPAWAFYQLMGSAAVQLCDEEGEPDA